MNPLELAKIKLAKHVGFYCSHAGNICRIKYNRDDLSVVYGSAHIEDDAWKIFLEKWTPDKDDSVCRQIMETLTEEQQGTFAKHVLTLIGYDVTRFPEISNGLPPFSQSVPIEHIGIFDILNASPSNKFMALSATLCGKELEDAVRNHPLIKESENEKAQQRNEEKET